MKRIPIAFFYGEGGPSPTIVLSAENLIEDRRQLVKTLQQIMKFVYSNWMSLNLKCCPTKIALIKASQRKDCELEYLFVQVIIDYPNFRFDFSGNCGHSLIAAAAQAIWRSVIPASEGLQRINVLMLNTNTKITIEVDTSELWCGRINCSIIYYVPFNSKLLPTGKPLDEIKIQGKSIPVSIINAGNPYILINANYFGIHSKECLFSDQEHLVPTLLEIRKQIGSRLGFSVTSVFPKIALVLTERGKDGYLKSLAARSIYVNNWHPSLGVTGLVCLGVATNIADSILYNVENPTEKCLTIYHSSGMIDCKTKSNKEGCTVVITNKRAKLILPPLSLVL
ncbi:PrpF domain-containing protein [Geobacillus subterraneus]|uniref:PrpF domain-containing protein n=1 Tax=Geobacillus subterraneus TaxID=129338 RepID=UPI001442BA09|nr:PrpF domain-containing protein [Geobacillus subterraneus]QIZ66983.1 hypothetical protein HF500_06760 [Geobacillus subterraneus]